MGVRLFSKCKRLFSQYFEFLLFIMLVSAYFGWLAYPLILTASENIRLVSVFNLDERLHARLLEIALEKSSLNIEFYNYGHLYFYVALLPLLFLSYVTPVSEQAIIVSLRLVTVIFGVGTVLITFILANRYFGRLTAWLSAGLLMFLPLNFLFWSVTSHPDVPQLFFIVLSIYLCLRLAQEGYWKWLVWASVAAGLAFSSKYSGIFLLPIIWLVMIVHQITDPNRDGIRISTIQFTKGMRYFTLVMGIVATIGGIAITPDFPARYLVFSSAIEETQKLILLNFMRRISILAGGSLIFLTVLKMFRSTNNSTSKPIAGLNKIVLKIVLSLAAFGLAFALTSPYALAGMGFLVGMLWEANHKSFGTELGAYHNGRLWFETLMSPQLLDGIILALAASSLVLTIYAFFKMGWKGVLSPQMVLWLWIIYYFGFLALRVNQQSFRFLLPIVPFLIILAMQSVSRIFHYIANRINKKYVPVWGIGIVLFIGGLEIPGAFDRILEFRYSTINREQNHTAVVAGEWLAATYPPSTRIFYDDYSYVPPQFSNVHLSPWTGETILELKVLEPDVIVVNQAMADRFSDINQAATYPDGQSNFMKKYEYYKALKNEELGYSLVRDFGPIQVYVKDATQ